MDLLVLHSQIAFVLHVLLFVHLHNRIERLIVIFWDHYLSTWLGLLGQLGNSPPQAVVLLGYSVEGLLQSSDPGSLLHNNRLQLRVHVFLVILRLLSLCQLFPERTYLPLQDVVACRYLLVLHIDLVEFGLQIHVGAVPLHVSEFYLFLELAYQLVGCLYGRLVALLQVLDLDLILL